MQYINFYDQLDHRREALISARRLLWMAGGFVILVVVIALQFAITTQQLAGALTRQQAQLSTLQSEVTALEQERQRLLQNVPLDAEIARLERGVAFRRQLLSGIDGGAGSQEGFATHLNGLANQHLDGLWFTRIHLAEGGREMALSGKVRAPELLPQYLQRLAGEGVFVGQQFRVLRISENQQTRDLDFEIRAREVHHQ